MATDCNYSCGDSVCNRDCYANWSGKALAFGAAIFMSTSHFLISLLAKSVNPIQITAMADGMVALLLGIHNIIRCKSFKVSSGERLFVVGYSVGLAVDLLATNFSLRYVPPFDSETIVSTNLIFTLIIAWIFLKESIDILNALSAILGLLGIVLISQPTFLFHEGKLHQDFRWSHGLGGALALFASLAVSSNMCLNRKIQETEPFTIVFFAFAFTGICSTTATFLGHVKTDIASTKNIILLISITISDFLKQLLLVKSLKTENAMTVALIAILNVPMVLILQISFSKIFPDTLTILGTFFVLISVFINVIKTPLLNLFGLTPHHCWFKTDNSIVNDDSYERLDY